MWTRQHTETDWKHYHLVYQVEKPKNQRDIKREDYLTYKDVHDNILNIPKNELSNKSKEVLLAGLEYCYFINKGDGMLLHATHSWGIISAIDTKLKFRYEYKSKFSRKEFIACLHDLEEKGFIYDLTSQRNALKNKADEPTKWYDIQFKIDFKKIQNHTVMEGGLF